MRMQKGLCIEINGTTSVFIGKNGEFLHGTPVGETNVGEESFFLPKQLVKQNNRNSFKPVWAPIIAALAVAILFLSVLLPEQEAFAYVQVQVNPGVEIGIDKEYEVVSIRELNTDGREIIGELGEWRNQSLEEVLDRVIALSMQETTEKITITTVADDEDETADEAVIESVLKISAKAMTRNITVQLKEASKKQWRASVEKSVPVGQLIHNSTNLVNHKNEEQKTNDRDELPFKIKQKPTQNNLIDKELKSTDKAEVTETNVESKTEKETQKNKAQSQSVPSIKQKEVPKGQEKRDETPAVKKGNSNPPGQEKRNEVPAESKNNKKIHSNEQPVKKEKESIQQKTEENFDELREKKDSSKAKENKEKSKPVISDIKNINEKSKVKKKDEFEKKHKKSNNKKVKTEK